MQVIREGFPGRLQVKVPQSQGGHGVGDTNLPADKSERSRSAGSFTAFKGRYHWLAKAPIS